jgi:hypothetical protein
MTDEEVEQFPILIEKFAKMKSKTEFHIGQKVRIRKESGYNGQCDYPGVITKINKDPDDTHTATVVFENHYTNIYRIGINGTKIIDLEPVED